MLLEATIIGFIVGKAKGGRMDSISAIYFRGTFFFLIGLILQIVPILLGYFKLMKGYYGVLSFIGILFMLLFLLRNLDKKGIALIALGALLNIIAMMFSGFAMPVDYKGLEYSGNAAIIEYVKDGSIANLTDVSKAPGIVKVLSKFIAVPSIYPLAKVLSVGDIVISIGLGWFVAAELCSRRHRQGIGRRGQNIN